MHRLHKSGMSGTIVAPYGSTVTRFGTKRGGMQERGRDLLPAGSLAGLPWLALFPSLQALNAFRSRLYSVVHGGPGPSQRQLLHVLKKALKHQAPLQKKAAPPSTGQSSRASVLLER